MAINTEPIKDGKSFSKIGEDVNNNFKNINDNFKEISTELGKVDSKISTGVAGNVVFGVYNGNDTESRVINLGFTPVAVEIYRSDGIQFSNGIEGGLALNGYPCHKDFGDSDIIKIINGGFMVYYNSKMSIYTNASGWTYYFKAYRAGSIVSIQ